MALVRLDQSNFTAGEIDPRVYARVDYAGYAKGAKQMRNFVVIPQGGFQRRFGTVYVDTLIATNPTFCDLWTLQYNDNITYMISVQANLITIYLENIAIATIATPYAQEDIQNIRFTQVENTLILANQNFQPRQIVRTPDSANVITGVDVVNNYIDVTTALTVGQILPIQFTTSGTLPTTNPQIFVNRDYFAEVVTTNSIRIYSSSEDAAANINFYAILSAGTGTSNVIVQNTWALNTITFIYIPPYDFSDEAYASLTFTPSATTGSITLTASGAIFTAAMVGGVFSGGNGVMRITGFTDSTHVTGFTVEDFSSTNPINGSLAFLGEPAWSDARGWPRTVGFYQQRLCFGGSTSISNGVWLSVTNQAFNFDDTENLDSNSISYYTSSGVSNYVVAITSTESFVIHTNSGTYSTPLGALTPVTPTNFYLVEQNKDGCSTIPPVHIDNQIIYIDRSGNNVKNLQYDLIQSKYVLNNLSVPSSSLIVGPVDMASYSDPEFTDGSYVFVVNSDGSLAVFQTLTEQSIAAWSLSTTAQSTTNGIFCHVASGINRSWFIVERTVNGAASLYIEELDFSLYTDCSKTYSNWNMAVLTGLNFLEGETSVQVNADGFYLGEFTVTSGMITLAQPYTNIQVGLPINSVFQPLPLNMQLANGGTLYKPKHVRTFYINYFQTYGAYMNGTLIPSVDMRNWVLGQPPVPINGVYEGTPMGDWDPFDPYADTLTISINQPFPATFIGISYIVEM